MRITVDVEAKAKERAALALPGTRALEGLSPNDVVRIEVLEDAASTSFYGARGGSGVIVIETRT